LLRRGVAAVVQRGLEWVVRRRWAAGRVR